MKQILKTEFYLVEIIKNMNMLNLFCTKKAFFWNSGIPP